MYSFESNKCLHLEVVTIRTPERHIRYMYLLPVGTRLTEGSGTPGTSGSKVPSYPRYLRVYTRGFLTPEVRTPEVVVWTSDFPEVPKPGGKNLCPSLYTSDSTVLMHPPASKLQFGADNLEVDE